MTIVVIVGIESGLALVACRIGKWRAASILLNLATGAMIVQIVRYFGAPI